MLKKLLGLKKHVDVGKVTEQQPESCLHSSDSGSVKQSKEQSLTLQFSSCFSDSVGHCVPPCFPCMQVLVRSLIPSPHSAEHSLNSLHSDFFRLEVASLSIGTFHCNLFTVSYFSKLSKFVLSSVLLTASSLFE